MCMKDHPMFQQFSDLQEEAHELDALLVTLAEADTGSCAL